MRIGRNIRDLEIPFKDEVRFSLENNFDIIQLWYHKGVIDMTYESDSISDIKNSGINVIIHGAFDINDFDKFEDDFINKLVELKMHEVILHPMIKTEEVNNETDKILVDKVLGMCNRLNKLNITVYIENNHKYMQSFYTLDQWKRFWNKAPKNAEFLLDIVHVLFCDDYDYLKELVDIKYPKALHIADTVKGMVGSKHTHLPIGNGIIDFKKIFQEILLNYDGLIILEIKNLDSSIIDSKNKLIQYLNKE